MKRMLMLLVILVAACVTSCAAGQPGEPNTTGLESRIESFSRPDKYGVVCYRDIYSSGTPACVQVQERADEQVRFK